MIAKGEYAADGWLVRIATSLRQILLIFSSSHVITMDLHASQIQGLPNLHPSVQASVS